MSPDRHHPVRLTTAVKNTPQIIDYTAADGALERACSLEDAGHLKSADWLIPDGTANIER